jgi:hypothetical protein
MVKVVLQMDELDRLKEAWDELLNTIATKFHLYQFLDWLVGVIDGKTK